LSDDAVVIRGEELEPAELELAIPGEHNRRNAACALAALAAAGVDADRAGVVLREFRGAGRRFQVVGERGGVRVVDDYAHHPTEVAVTIAAAREVAPEGRVRVLFQPHLFSRTVHLAADFAVALAQADDVVLTGIYAAREQPIPGVTGRVLVERLCEARPGMPVGWAPSLEEAAELMAARCRPGDLVLTVGAGDVDRAGPLLLRRLRG
jgi:UDP-N-acetylmuramate--alanine ligase